MSKLTIHTEGVAQQDILRNQDWGNTWLWTYGIYTIGPPHLAVTVTDHAYLSIYTIGP